MKIFGITGWKNNGKTTLMAAVIRTLSARGLSVSSIKHAHHDFDVDQPGKDSYRHREAGAREVLVGSARRWALIHELRGETEPNLDALLQKLAPVDLVLVEGFKRHDHPKIEVSLKATDTPLIAPGDPSVVAVATDDDTLALPVPRLPIDDPAVVADFILTRLDMAPAAHAGHSTP